MKPSAPEGGYLNLAVAQDLAVKKFSSRDPQSLARDAAVSFQKQESTLTVPFLHQVYRVEHPSGRVYDAEGKEAAVYQSIVILHYLITANGNPLSGEWISYRHLPGGEIYTEPFRRRAVLPFLKAYGEDPEAFVRAADALDARRNEGSGYSMIISAFPRVPLNFTLWPGDDELPASAAILFDAQASSYLPTEDYAHLPALVLKTMQQLSSR